MKTLFVAIGSTSTLALSELISRLIDLDIYKSDDSFKDVFVGIDTATDPLNALSKFNTGGVAHTHTITFKNSAGNVPSHNFLRAGFRPDWTKEKMEIRAAHLGVGGLRVKSFSTLEWKQQLNMYIDNFFRGVTNTLDDCQVILVSSAWGGTATGMFQNVADFIAAKIFEKCGNDTNNLTPFYIFLAMPDYSASQGVFRTSGYQGMENFVYMMREIQQAGWRGSLNKGDGLKEASFIFPEFFDFPLDGKDWLPVFNHRERLRGTSSVLGAKAVVLIPSLLPGATMSTIAEELLFFVYLNIIHRNLFPSNNTPAAKFIDVRRDGPQDNVVIGINMVECQLEYDAALRKIVANRLWNSWNTFIGKGTLDTRATQFVRNFLKNLIKKPDDTRLETNILKLLKQRLSSLKPEDVNALKSSIDDFVRDSKDEAYSFAKFGSELFTKMDEFAKKLPENDELREAFYDKLVLKDVQKAYQDQVRSWLDTAKEKEDEQKKLVADKVDKIKKMIDRAVTEYRRLKSNEGRNSLIINLCNGADAVPREYIDIAEEEIKKALQDLQELMLIQATIRKYGLNSEAAKFEGNWESVTKYLEDKTRASSNVAHGPAFIKKVDDPRLPDLIQQFQLVHIKSSNLIELVECSGSDTASLGKTYDRICDDFIQEAKKVIADPNLRVDAGDVSMVTLANANKVTCCSPVYQLGGKDAIPQNLFHFYAKCEGSGTITWEDVCNLGFGSFLRCKNAAVVDGQTVAFGDLDLGTGIGDGVWFDSDVRYGDKKLYGMWLGSVNLSMYFKDVFDKSYAIEQRKNISENAKKREQSNAGVQCCNTLFEKVVIGSILGILNRKLAVKQVRDMQELAVSIKISDTIKWDDHCFGKNVADHGFLYDGTSCSITKISAQFIKTVMEWLHQNDNGSCLLADALGCKDLFASLTDQDRYVLQNMSLTPTDTQWKLIGNLYEKLDSCINVTVSGE